MNQKILRAILREVLDQLSTVFVLVFALYMFAWERFWPWAKRFAVYIGRFRLVARLEEWIKSLPGWGAIASFFSGVLLVLPLKILALFIIAQGGFFFCLLGGAVFVFAKAVGGAYVTWIFKLVLPTLMRYRWFEKCYNWVTRTIKRLHEWADAQPVYQDMMRFKRHLFQEVVEFGQRSSCVGALATEYARAYYKEIFENRAKA